MSGIGAIWPWLAVAGAGALHGLNPCTGWGLAAACGMRSRNDQQALAALLPIAVGHATSTAAVAAMVALGLSMSGAPLLWLAAGLLPAVVWLRRTRPRLSDRAGRAGLGLSSFIAATAHGSGLMLVPALVPLCLSGSPAREITASGSLLLALAAVAVHMAAMLAVTAAAAWVACRAVGSFRPPNSAQTGMRPTH